MKPGTLIGLGAFIGSAVGSYVPGLWGGAFFSTSGIILSFVGGIVGMYCGYLMSQSL